ncbi:iron complex transport system substrate-binding protein [Natronoarchaeum philippinense]|uniref:Iron complex transport system substrate-binding protein n=1 Tax=Natronoarchaeum philippinense TaxID=558529 RepID=A0A285N7C6_NATPI|nr:PGF-CTERM-anchored ABC transporter substrate-binding protein [Natronoarchaeum philippinense]SNZ05228.1 iron complex transport system substrate-binding protein [Natronoarchaeum philippinense]
MTRTRTSVAVAALAIVAMVAGVAAPIGAAPTAGPDAAGAAASTAPVADLQQNQSNCSFPQTFTDAGGTEVTVENEPQEIVTLNPSAAQTLWEIGGREKVVGVSQYATYLEGAEDRTIVSNEDGTTSTEVVVDLDPDLVLAPNTIPPETVGQLRDNGLTVYQFASATSIEDVYDKTERIGALTGECQGATETVEWMQTEIDAVRENVTESDRPSVYMEFSSGWTTGAGTFQHDVITTAGAQNTAAEAGLEGWGEISDEQLLNQSPEFLLLLGETQVPDRQAVQSTSAVQNDRIIRVDRNYAQQPAPRVVYVVQAINEAVQNYESESASQNNESDAGNQSDGDNIPGFGGVAALVALLSVALFARKR